MYTFNVSERLNEFLTRQKTCSSAPNMEEEVGIELLNPVTIDNGSYMISAGFAGSDSPRAVFETRIGNPKFHETAMIGMSVKTYYIGDEAQVRRRGGIQWSRPMKGGIIEDWADMERIWHYIFYNELRIAPEDGYPVVMTDNVLSPK